MRARLWQFERIEYPIVKRSVHFEFQRANRVRNPFDVIAERVRPVVHRINAPLVTGAMMGCVPNTVQHRIAQPDIGRVHVNLRAQCARPIGEFARFHSRKQVEIFLD